MVSLCSLCNAGCLFPSAERFRMSGGMKGKLLAVATLSLGSLICQSLFADACQVVENYLEVALDLYRNGLLNAKGLEQISISTSRQVRRLMARMPKGTDSPHAASRTRACMNLALFF